MKTVIIFTHAQEILNAASKIRTEGDKSPVLNKEAMVILGNDEDETIRLIATNDQFRAENISTKDFLDAVGSRLELKIIPKPE